MASKDGTHCHHIKFSIHTLYELDPWPRGEVFEGEDLQMRILIPYLWYMPEYKVSANIKTSFQYSFIFTIKYSFTFIYSK